MTNELTNDSDFQLKQMLVKTLNGVFDGTIEASTGDTICRLCQCHLASSKVQLDAAKLDFEVHKYTNSLDTIEVEDVTLAITDEENEK